MSQKIAVLGTGANGSCIAANLVKAGRDVMLIDQWPEHVETMRRDGLRITHRQRADGELHVPVRAFHLCDIATFNEPFDVVLLAMKAYDTRWACEMIKPHLKPDGMLIGMQNGMAAECHRRRGRRRAHHRLRRRIVIRDVHAGCRAAQHTAGQDLDRAWPAAGGSDAVSPRCRRCSRPVGKVEIKPNILAAKWMKLVVNAMCLGPFAMVGMPLIDALKVPGMRDLIIEIGEEAMRVGHDLGHPVEPIFGLTEQELAGANRPAEKLFDTLAAHVGPGRSRNTVLQDLLKGRDSEVDMINGLVVEESERRGYAAPANARVAEIVRQIEAGTLKPGSRATWRRR